jgi:hypothetical protein
VSDPISTPQPKSEEAPVQKRVHDFHIRSGNLFDEGVYQRAGTECEIFLLSANQGSPNRTMKCVTCEKVKHLNDFDNSNAMSENTELYLKVFLAKQLPEEIEIFANLNFFWIKGNLSVTARVTPREWDYIVRRVEDNLTEEQQEQYTLLVHSLVGNSPFWWAILHASWQTRAKALQHIAQCEKEAA